MSHEEQAAALFGSGCNCAQSVFAAFCDVTGIERTLALRLASGFGAGMGRMRETCGAVTGMFLVLDALCGTDGTESDAEKGAHYARVQRLAEDFRALHGTLVCRELLSGIQTTAGTQPQARTEAYYGERPCARFVRSAARLMDAFLAEQSADALTADALTADAQTQTAEAHAPDAPVEP